MSSQCEFKTADRVSWSTKCGGQTYTEGKITCDIGDLWGRRTTVFCALDPTAQYAIVKEWHHKRRLKESDLLAAVHTDGDLRCEDVKVNGPSIECSAVGGTLRRKKRLALYDYGFDLLLSESVNALLRAFYDVLEAHRTLLKKGILHRDMNINNILIRSVFCNLPGRHVMKDPQPLIETVLSGTLRPEKLRTVEGCLIDFDNSANLARKGVAPVDINLLVYRTGSPKYIARSVALGRVLRGPIASSATPMPELTGDAKKLYINAYGEDRYNAYAEEIKFISPLLVEAAQMCPQDFPPEFLELSMTVHGGRPPTALQASTEKHADMPFTHRPEHDVESVTWTMISVLTRIHPAHRPQETSVPISLYWMWRKFNDHAIYANPNSLQDTRNCILTRELEEWLSDFEPFPEFKDLAYLLHDIVCQVRSEYALWDPAPPHADHLHEGVQRLILQYLVDHKDKDVKLAGDLEKQKRILRPVDKILDSDSVQADGTVSKNAELAFVTEAFPAVPATITSQSTKRKSRNGNPGTPDAPKTKRRKGGNGDAAA